MSPIYSLSLVLLKHFGWVLGYQVWGLQLPCPLLHASSSRHPVHMQELAHHPVMPSCSVLGGDRCYTIDHDTRQREYVPVLHVEAIDPAREREEEGI